MALAAFTSGLEAAASEPRTTHLHKRARKRCHQSEQGWRKQAALATRGVGSKIFEQSLMPGGGVRNKIGR